jgi:hypothetical protein
MQNHRKYKYLRFLNDNIKGRTTGNTTGLELERLSDLGIWFEKISNSPTFSPPSLKAGVSEGAV